MQYAKYLTTVVFFFFGFACGSESSDPCDPNPCHNGGVCSEGDGEAVCACPEETGWSGAFCETCLIGWDESCTACASGYSPMDGECVLNPCDPNPCHNGGVCSEGDGEAVCACPEETGWSGAFCETCLIGWDESCTACASGYSPMDGECVRNPCDPNPCHNGGVCSEGDGEAVCACPEETGWSGAFCETCLIGWDESCTACASGYSPMDGECVRNPCSPEDLSGRCPAGSSCDGTHGYCKPDDPLKPCLDYWEVEDGIEETPLCAALHDSGFLLDRTGPGFSPEDWLDHFDDMWALINDHYGAFDAAPVDWDEVYLRYRERAESIESKYEQTKLLANMYAELKDAHTSYHNDDLCDNGLALYTFGYFYNFYPMDIHGELYIYYSDDSRVNVGDKIVSVNGLQGEQLRAYWRERLKCEGTGDYSESTEHDSFISSVLSLVSDPLFEGTQYESMLGVLIEDDEGNELFLPPPEHTLPETATQWVHDLLAYYGDEAPVYLQWKAYDAGPVWYHQTTYFGYSTYQNVGILVFYHFVGQEEFGIAIREVIESYPDVIGWIIDIRDNFGGEGYGTDLLTTFFIQQAISLPTIVGRIEGSDPPAYGGCPFLICPEELLPDPDLNLDLPVAVLTSGFSRSVADFLPYQLAMEPNARLFGSPTCGAFGSPIWFTSEYESFSVFLNWVKITDNDDNPMQGVSVEPDFSVTFNYDDVVNQVDPVLDEAVAWILSQ